MTTTLSDFVDESPPASLAVRSNWYVPALEKVATALLAALVALAEKLTAAGGVPVTDQL